LYEENEEKHEEVERTVAAEVVKNTIISLSLWESSELSRTDMRHIKPMQFHTMAIYTKYNYLCFPYSHVHESQISKALSGYIKMMINSQNNTPTAHITYSLVDYTLPQLHIQSLNTNVITIVYSTNMWCLSALKQPYKQTNHSASMREDFRPNKLLSHCSLMAFSVENLSFIGSTN
jgi:hypothetical protein